jgi:hypothetical protein
VELMLLIHWPLLVVVLLNVLYQLWWQYQYP